MRKNQMSSVKMVFLVFCLMLVKTGSATSYYCSPNGSMGNNGLSTSTPWDDLETVISQKSFANGDIIYLMTGNHGFPVITENNTAFVTITAASGASPVLDGLKFNGASYWYIENIDITSNGTQVPETPILDHPVSSKMNNTLVQVMSSSYITLDNCFVYSVLNSSSWTATDWNYKAWTAYLAEESNNITVDGCHFKNINFGFDISGNCSYTTLKNSIIENFGGDGARAQGSNALIEDNIIRDSYDTNGNHDDGIQTVSGTTNVTIRRNQILNVTDFSRNFIGQMQGIYAMADVVMTNYVIENNLISVDHWNAICLGQELYNSKIVNNTLVQRPDFDPDSNTRQPRIWIQNNRTGAQSSDIIIRNNIVHHHTAPFVFGPSESTTGIWTLDHNLGYLTYPDDYEDLFVEFTTSSIDLHLAPTATSAIDLGTTTSAPADDIEKNNRATPYDIGCYEYWSENSITLNPVADAYVRGGSYENSNFGTSTSIAIKSTSAPEYERIGFMKFNLTGITGTVTSAKLRLYISSASTSTSHSLKFVSNDSWTETGIKYSNKPSAGSVIDSKSISTTGWVEFDVTSIVESEAGEYLSIEISEDDLANTSYNYDSKEGTNKPELIVESVEEQTFETTLNTTADAYVRGGTYQNNNYGSSSVIDIKSTSALDYARIGFLKFNLSDIPGIVDSAILRLYLSASGGTSSHSARFVSNDSWTETGITYSNKPSPGSVINSWSVSTTGWVEIDVKSIVSSEVGGYLSLEISEDNLGNKQFTYQSKEGTNKPELVINSHVSFNDAFYIKPSGGEQTKGNESSVDLGNELTLKKEFSVKILPNTVENTYINMDINGININEKLEIYIFNMSGKMIYMNMFKPDVEYQNVQIPNTGLITNGIYLIRINNGDHSKTEKIMVK